MRNQLYARHGDSEVDADLEFDDLLWFAAGALAGYLIRGQVAPLPAPTMAGNRERVIDAEVIEETKGDE